MNTNCITLYGLSLRYFDTNKQENLLYLAYFFFYRYNRLLEAIHGSLQNLLKALKGLVVLSQELEMMANSLYDNSVPNMWAKKVGIFPVL